MHTYRLILRYCFTVVFSSLLSISCSDGSKSAPNGDGHIFDPDGGHILNLTVNQVDPSHGPARGGAQVVVRGTGFVDGTRIFFGENMVDPATVVLLDHTRISCLTPGGAVGRVTVRATRPEGVSAELPEGYTYDAFYVDPSSGSVNGNTFIRIIGTDTGFAEGDLVTFGGKALLEPRVISPTVITGRTPPAVQGSVSVKVDGTDGTYEVEDAYEYYTGVDPVNGGLGGGPIQGELSVTLLDSYTEEPIAGGFVILGASSTTPYQGTTDESGRITFSDPYLTGPQMVSAAAPEYERVSFVTFDAREVTAYLTPEIPPNPGTFPGVAYSAVYGKIRFGGIEPGEDNCLWPSFIPTPEENQQRVVKIYQTVSDYDWSTPKPGEDGIIREDEECDQGYSFWIYTYPGTYAVYAIGGLEDRNTLEFTPTAAGFTRAVITAPGEVKEVDVGITMPLNETLSVSLSDPPPLDEVLGPVAYRVRLFLDLGGDGYAVREEHVAVTTDATSPVQFTALAPLMDTIQDGTYSVMAEAYNYGLYPYSQKYLPDIIPAATPSITADLFLGIPIAVDPPPDGTTSSQRMIWSAGGVDPTFFVVLLRTYPDGDAYWRLYINGLARSFSLPDLAGIGDLTGHPAGPMSWHIVSAQVPGMSFDEFTYRYMSDRYWTATAAAMYQFSFSGSP